MADFGDISSGLSIGAGQAVRRNAGNSAFEAFTPNIGTVTSVAASVPSFLAVSGSPITSSGTLTISLQTQTAKTFFAGPTSGSAAAPTFRAIAMVDLGSGSPSSSNFLRGDGSWQAISTGLTIASTTITSGASNRLLFENSSHVVSESANLTFASDILSVNSQTISAGSSVSNDSIFVGKNTGNTTHSSVHNSAFGNTALQALTSGYRNTAIGVNVLNSATSGAQNTCVGAYSMTSLTTGSNNIAIGAFTLATLTTQANNLAMGANAGEFATGNNCFYLGLQSGKGASSGTPNSGDANIGIGINSLLSNSTGQGSVGIGYLSLAANTTGSLSVGIGYQALTGATTGDDNVAIGPYCLRFVTTGGQNVAIGRKRVIRLLPEAEMFSSVMVRAALKPEATNFI
jgi:hypothetical protein